MTERNYLVFDDTLRDTAAQALFDAALAQVAAGTAQVDREYPAGLVVEGKKLLGEAVLRYAIEAPAAEFDAAQARAFAERMRLLFGWNTIGYTLRTWVETRLRDAYFVNEGSKWKKQWVRIPDADGADVPEAFFEFACHVAISDLKHGPSYAFVSANEIFGWVTALGSGLPTRLQKHGTGELPADLARLRSEAVTITVNDALAVVRIAVKKASEDAYAAVLDHLVRLLHETDFPRSYAIEFRGPTKTYLPIKGLPKKGVHQLFACAAAYPDLHPRIECYARAAMGEDEWYQNLEDEDCAMPGTFAVFALGLAGAGYAPLVLDYLRKADGEHQSMQAKFVEAYIDMHGFTSEVLACLVACAGNIQHLRYRKEYPALMANRSSLEALLALRCVTAGDAASGIAALHAHLGGQPVADYAWRATLHALWGEDAERNSGRATIDNAPDELKGLYQKVFA